MKPSEDQQEPVPVATTSTTSDSTTAAEATASDDFCEVCFVAPRGGLALVPCGHARFCEACAMRVSAMEGGVRCVALKLPWSCVFYPR